MTDWERHIEGLNQVRFWFRIRKVFSDRSLDVTQKLIPSISSKLIVLAFAGDILGVNVWGFWRMLLTVNLAEQIQSSEIISRDIFLKGASSKLCQWHSLQEIINIYKLQNGNHSDCLSLKLILQIWSFLLLNFWSAESEHLSPTPRYLSFWKETMSALM